jgi:hypothetical protein
VHNWAVSTSTVKRRLRDAGLLGKVPLSSVCVLLHIIIYSIYWPVWDTVWFFFATLTRNPASRSHLFTVDVETGVLRALFNEAASWGLVRCLFLKLDTLMYLSSCSIPLDTLTLFSKCFPHPGLILLLNIVPFLTNDTFRSCSEHHILKLKGYFRILAKSTSSASHQLVDTICTPLCPVWRKLEVVLKANAN